MYMHTDFEDIAFNKLNNCWSGDGVDGSIWNIGIGNCLERLENRDARFIVGMPFEVFRMRVHDTDSEYDTWLSLAADPNASAELNFSAINSNSLRTNTYKAYYDYTTFEAKVYMIADGEEEGTLFTVSGPSKTNTSNSEVGNQIRFNTRQSWQYDPEHPEDSRFSVTIPLLTS